MVSHFSENEAETWFVGCATEANWFQHFRRLRLADVSVLHLFRPGNCIQVVMDFLHTLTPDEGLVLFLLGLLTLLACLGFAVWLVVS